MSVSSGRSRTTSKQKQGAPAYDDDDQFFNPEKKNTALAATLAEARASLKRPTRPETAVSTERKLFHGHDYGVTSRPGTTASELVPSPLDLSQSEPSRVSRARDAANAVVAHVPGPQSPTRRRTNTSRLTQSSTSVETPPNSPPTQAQDQQPLTPMSSPTIGFAFWLKPFFNIC